MPITLKKDIIDNIYNQIKPFDASGITYNNIMLYSYFHNDVVKDMESLWDEYQKLKLEYDQLKQYYNDTEQWKASIKSDIQALYDYYNTASSIINGLSGNYWVDASSHYTEPGELSAISDCMGPDVKDSFLTLNDPYTSINMSEFDPNNLTLTAVPIDNYTYTWNKDMATYNMPYNNTTNSTYSIHKNITYLNEIKDYGTVMVFSYLKFNNNRYENHMPLIM